MNILIGYPKCSTCKNAEKYLKDNDIEYKYRDIKLDTPSKQELKNIFEMANLDIKKLFNTSGLVYKKMNLKDKLNSMSIDDKINLLSSDGMLIKRPIFIYDNKILIGFTQKKWDDVIK